MAKDIEIGGRLHSTATGNTVAGANEVLDDTKNKKQNVINAEVDEAIGDDNTAGTIKGRIKAVESSVETLNGDTSTSGSVAKAIADAKTELIGGATSDGNTLKKVEDRTATLETAVGSNGSVDQRIAAAKSEVIGDAASDYNTLGKLEDKIQAEASARQDAITAEANRATTRENQIYDLVHTPEQHYVTVATYADLANIASPSDDTIYRVSSYNGKTSQVDNTVYSEYGYDGTNFVFLCVKSQIDEVYDISAHHSNNTYVDLAAALDGGNNIPQELRKGGMSVKFVQSSDNKYIQFRCIADEFTTDTTQWAIVDGGVYVENPEYVYVKTDAEGKILWAIKVDGGIYYGAGVPQQVIDYIEEKIADLSLDEYEDIVAFLNGLEEGDKTLQTLLNEKVNKEEGKSLIDAEYADGVSHIENPEFAEVHTDAEDKVLYGVKQDGDFYFGAGVPSQVQDELNNKVDLADLADLVNSKVDKEEGKSLINEGVAESMSAIEDPEGRSEITTDSEGKIISYRDIDGVKHENVGIESTVVNTNSLNLTAEGMTEFQKALKNSGFNPGGTGDWSEYITNDGDNPLHLPTPRCIKLNFTGVNSFPSSKTADAPAIVEYWDMQGNYFKKNCLLNAHGQQTLMFPKKNITVDLLDADYDSGDAFSIAFGDWVGQDSFHLKAYYSDDLRGKGCIGYKIYEEFMKTRGPLDNRPYMKYIKSIMDDSSSEDQVKVNVTHATGARCFPDGFPAIVYLNGEFWGVYSFQLKKNRKNYFLDSKTAKNIHLEGMISYERFFNGTINWEGGSYGIEVKNPKNLYYQNSNNGKAQKYDFDGGHIVDGHDDQEIMGTDSEYYDLSSDKAKDFKRCAQSKGYIEAFARYIPELIALKNGGATDAEIKEACRTRFDIDFMIDYLILQNLIGNHDSISNNCQWTTWDGIQWCPNPYDLNDSFKKWNSKLGDSLNYPFGWCWTYFLQEMKDRYQVLRNSKVIDVNNLIWMIEDWMLKVGEENYELENEKWPASAMQGDTINTDFWKEIEYNSSYPTYVVGDYAAGSKVNMNWEGEDRSFEALVNIQHSQYTDLVAYSNRMSLFDYKDVLDHNIANLDNWLNS